MKKRNGSIGAMSRIALLAAVALFAALPLGAQTADITQIDSTGLMAWQKTRLYAHLLDASGRVQESPDASELKVWESDDGMAYKDVGKLRLIDKTAGQDKGITFLFLIDNSGSMYYSLDDKPTRDSALWRATAARQAADDFLASIKGSGDSVGVAYFNTRYGILAPPSRDIAVASGAMDKITEPAIDDAFTELYASITEACASLGTVGGRKALIVLSDGENYPFFDRRKEPSPQFGRKQYRWREEALEEAVRQGVTVFAINFATVKMDGNLGDIAEKSGGITINAADRQALADAYASIRERIMSEILVEYSAKMFSSDTRWVKMTYLDHDEAKARARYYYTGTVFGKASGGYSAWILLALPLGLLLLFLLSLIRFEKPSLSANLSLLYAPGIGRGTRVFNVGDKTVIGSDATADITITGSSRLEASPVTVVKDPTSGRFTIAGDEAITVNNRQVKTKTLEPGDVINFNGTMVVFDDADTDALLTKPGTNVKKKHGPGRKWK